MLGRLPKVGDWFLCELGELCVKLISHAKVAKALEGNTPDAVEVGHFFPHAGCPDR